MLKNLTGHTVALRRTDGAILHLRSACEPAVVAVERVRTGQEEGVATYLACYGEVANLPEPVEGVTYLVTPAVCRVAAHAGRSDVVTWEGGSQDDPPNALVAYDFGDEWAPTLSMATPAKKPAPSRPWWLFNWRRG